MPSRRLEDLNAETVVSRMPSPSREETLPSHTLEDLIAENPIVISRAPPQKGEKRIADPDEARASTDVEDSSNESGDDDLRWSTVKRGRAQSLDSARTNLKNKKIIYLNKQLSYEQKRTVDVATGLLTSEQKDRVQRRQDNLRTVPQLEENSPIPGPSQNKGKTVDPREWGNAGIESEELDIGVQEAIIKAYERGRKEAGKNARKTRNENEENFPIPPVVRHRSTTLHDHTQGLVGQRAGSRPAAQLVPNSSLGVALEKVARMVEQPDDPSEPSETTSDYESSSNYSRSVRSHNSSRS